MTTKLSILVIEDEKNICDFISTTLLAQDYKVFKAYSAGDGLSLITSQCPDVILLDLGLPDLDGIDIIKQVRTWSSVPIIVISARIQEKEKVPTYDSMISQIWGPYADTNNRILRVNMANIRRKMKLNPAEPKYIFTEIGIGYRMIEEDTH